MNQNNEINYTTVLTYLFSLALYPLLAPYSFSLALCPLIVSYSEEE
jgi:hypothetical protein